MTDQDPGTTTVQSQDRIDELLDEPCANPRYGGMALREAVRTVVLRRGDPMAHRPAEVKGEVVDKRTL